MCFESCFYKADEFSNAVSYVIPWSFIFFFGCPDLQRGGSQMGFCKGMQFLNAGMNCRQQLSLPTGTHAL